MTPMLTFCLAHDDAYFKAHILHRDISVGNIIICGTRGLLIDWDMCAKVHPEKKVARRPKRTASTCIVFLNIISHLHLGNMAIHVS
jgi:RIO-like serine/threonine protein kinase